MKSILTAALAACAVASLAAGSASAESARLPYGDLNLSTASGAAALDARIDAVARSMCKGATRTGSHLSDAPRCSAAVRAEAVSLLPAQARAQYAASRRPITL
jgi:UrcA family protein